MTTIRASKLALALACPASLAPPEFALVSDSPEARLGSAVHQVLAALVRGGDWQAQIAPAAAEWRVAAEDVERLSWAGKRAWDRLACQFPDPTFEAGIAHTCDGLTLTGHPDFYSVVGAELRLGDWKTGYADEDHEQQLRGYAWMLLQPRHELSSALAVVVRLREMTQDVYRWTREELDAWFAGVVRDTADATKFNPGRHCGFCPRRLHCDARDKYVVASITELAAADVAASRTWPDSLLAVYDRIKLIEAACDRGRDVLRSEIEAYRGAVTGTDGRTLALVEQQRREIDAAAAWGTLDERFGFLPLLGAVRLNKAAVEDLAKQRAPRGQKGAAVKALMDDLDAAGAIVTTTTQRLEVSRNGSGTSSNANGPAVTTGTAGERGEAAAVGGGAGQGPAPVDPG